MTKMIALGLLVAGVVLLIFGVSELNSMSSDFSRIFTGAPTDRSIWMVTGGAALAVVGLAGIVFQPGKS
ncbi:MAG: DUF3185 family protein [Gallionella sp.]